jgi:hypothetical protein
VSLQQRRHGQSEPARLSGIRGVSRKPDEARGGGSAGQDRRREVRRLGPGAPAPRRGVPQSGERGSPRARRLGQQAGRRDPRPEVHTRAHRALVSSGSKGCAVAAEPSFSATERPAPGPDGADDWWTRTRRSRKRLSSR